MLWWCKYSTALPGLDITLHLLSTMKADSSSRAGAVLQIISTPHSAQLDLAAGPWLLGSFFHFHWTVLVPFWQPLPWLAPWLWTINITGQELKISNAWIQSSSNEERVRIFLSIFFQLHGPKMASAAFSKAKWTWSFAPSYVCTGSIIYCSPLRHTLSNSSRNWLISSVRFFCSGFRSK